MTFQFSFVYVCKHLIWYLLSAWMRARQCLRSDTCDTAHAPNISIRSTRICTAVEKILTRGNLHVSRYQHMQRWKYHAVYPCILQIRIKNTYYKLSLWYTCRCKYQILKEKENNRNNMPIESDYLGYRHRQRKKYRSRFTDRYITMQKYRQEKDKEGATIYLGTKDRWQTRNIYPIHSFLSILKPSIRHWSVHFYTKLVGLYFVLTKEHLNFSETAQGYVVQILWFYWMRKTDRDLLDINGYR